MANVRPDNSVISTWDEVDDALREISEIDGRVATAENLATRQKAQIDEKLKDSTAADTDRKKLLELALERFVTANRTDFAPRQSRTLQHGRVGFRRSERVSFERPESEVVQAILEHEAVDADAALRSKVTVDKKYVADLGDAILGELGIKRDVLNSFIYKPNTTKRADTGRRVTAPKGVA